MNWLQLGESIAAILVLAGTAWALKLGEIAPIADEAAARRMAEADVSGFDAANVWLAHDRHRAVVFGRDRSIALIRPHGAHYIVRRIELPTATRTGQFVEIDSGDPQVGRPFGRFALRLSDHAAAAALVRDLQAGTTTDTDVGKSA